jgi:hypothetical protein
VLQVSRARLAEVIIDEVRAFLSLPSCQRELTEYEGRYISGRIVYEVEHGHSGDGYIVVHLLQFVPTIRGRMWTALLDWPPVEAG